MPPKPHAAAPPRRHSRSLAIRPSLTPTLLLHQVVVGQCNKQSSGDLVAWDKGDAVFRVGNGHADDSGCIERRDAFRVMKDGLVYVVDPEGNEHELTSTVGELRDNADDLQQWVMKLQAPPRRLHASTLSRARTSSLSFSQAPSHSLTLTLALTPTHSLRAARRRRRTSTT